MKRRAVYLIIVVCTAALACARGPAAEKPNIVVILADDVGYGDLGCYGARRIKTPALDRLAREGVRFTDGHSPSATCTPTRYALMTGEYPWRKPGTGVLPGDAKLIVEPGRTTLASMLKQAGYATAVVGKWHLGLGAGSIDWNSTIAPGPREIGFDESFIIPATGDRVPCVYVQNGRVVGLDPNDPIRVSYAAQVGDEPTGRDHPELLKMKLARGHDGTIVNGISRIGFMAGGRAARWVDEDMSDVLTREAVRFIEQNRQRPFFLYFPTHDCHVPRVPHARFRGRSGCGLRGDAIEELDDAVGTVLKALDDLGLSDNTLVIFSSDNGPVINDGYADGAVEALGDHQAAGSLRGGKYSTFEGGTRVPFLLRWPARVKPGESAALVCQIDLLASLAALVGQPLAADAAPDSMNILPALLGEEPRGRELLVEHAAGLALRKGPWKYIAPRVPRTAPKARPSAPMLFNLATDLAEAHDLAAQQPKVVRELDGLLEQIRTAGRSRPK